MAIRTAFIVGFPGETADDFAELSAFVRETRFDRAGVFRYSREEGTAAAELPGQLPDRVKRQRFDALMRVQGEVSAALHQAMVGRDVPVLACGEDERGRTYGRMPSQAPDIDGGVFLRGAPGPGTIGLARITAAHPYDLDADWVADRAPGPVAKFDVDRAGDYL